MRRNSARVLVDGQPVSWVGANFWSRTGGPFMWRGYDPDVVRDELRVLREHGLTMTRSFFFWPDFMPEPDAIDEDMAARFADFLDRHAEQRMSTVPTFIVGHMSGENWDPAWRGGRDLYADVWMVGRQAWFAGEMTRRFGPHPAVAGWLVSNEMPLYGGDHAPPEAVAAWAQIIRDAVRAAATTGSGSPTPPRCATSSARTRTRWATTGSGSTTRPRGSASWLARSAVRWCSRSSGSARTSRRSRTRPATTGTPCTTACWPARPAGAHGRTPTSTCPARTRTGTTPSSSTSASPTRPACRRRRWLRCAPSRPRWRRSGRAAARGP